MVRSLALFGRSIGQAFTDTSLLLTSGPCARSQAFTRRPSGRLLRVSSLTPLCPGVQGSALMIVLTYHLVASSLPLPGYVSLSLSPRLPSSRCCRRRRLTCVEHSCPSFCHADVRLRHRILRRISRSPTMTEGGIAEWKIKEGEAFSAGDVLLEIVRLSDRPNLRSYAVP